MSQKKPSELIAEKMPELRKQLEDAARELTLLSIGSHWGDEQGALNLGILNQLDAEHERRAAFEREALGRMARLERIARGGDEPLTPFATPIAEAMPDCEQRVLFFVPGHDDPDRRWRVGAYTCPPIYCETEWQDEESEAGDVGISWRPDEVTHWMPLPGEPV